MPGFQRRMRAPALRILCAADLLWLLVALGVGAALGYVSVWLLPISCAILAACVTAGAVHYKHHTNGKVGALAYASRTQFVGMGLCVASVATLAFVYVTSATGLWCAFSPSHHAGKPPSPAT